ncbi:universal stress protein [Roseicella frigidaeris]|uniref:Universal stress protein n=1 Tax=Roseicella frigidaeris TaxID=2230885 RepID=A0A327M1E2_9PROT|nr:universal stress protein [Roseicella frigidaeris]RAI56105.1 universal stress protein [Roseicella frigidaeris]
MALKDILVHLDASPRAAGRLRLAADLARRHDAHLVGLFVVDALLPAFAMADAGNSAPLVGQVLDQLRADALRAGAGVEAGFRDAMRREGLAGEWRLVEGALPEVLALHARYADLAILGQTDPEASPPGAAQSVERVLFAAGRPVLLVPHDGSFESLGRHVLVGWNASREAARAVADALPILAAAERVTVLAVNPGDAPGAHGAEPGADIALHLARHGVKAEVEHVTASGLPDGVSLLNRAAELGPDLLVVGAYGHSRLRELALGGVTRTLLREMTVPVLMSH